jgi:hypothetical protein
MGSTAGEVSGYDASRVYCPKCKGAARAGSRNRISPTHVEYRCVAGHGFFAVRELSSEAARAQLDDMPRTSDEIGAVTMAALRETAAFHAEDADKPLGLFAEGAVFEVAQALEEAEAALELGEGESVARLTELVDYLTDVAKVQS